MAHYSQGSQAQEFFDSIAKSSLVSGVNSIGTKKEFGLFCPGGSMKNTRVWIGGFVFLMMPLILMAGCNTMGRQPQFRAAAIAPAVLKPGESAVITVQVKDRHNIVRKVEGVVQEDPNIKLKLHDDGQPPDAKAGDGVWSLKVDVPFQAPSGKFLLELTAYRADGTPVPVHTKEGKTAPLSTAVPVVIESQ